MRGLQQAVLQSGLGRAAGWFALWCDHALCCRHPPPTTPACTNLYGMQCLAFRVEPEGQLVALLLV